LTPQAGDAEDGETHGALSAHNRQIPIASSSGRALDESDREKLADVLRELLDCKRLLERAREG
jgi:hypothetical protein